MKTIIKKSKTFVDLIAVYAVVLFSLLALRAILDCVGY